jgi:hypothetical protein
MNQSCEVWFRIFVRIFGWHLSAISVTNVCDTYSLYCYRVVYEYIVGIQTGTDGGGIRIVTATYTTGLDAKVKTLPSYGTVERDGTNVAIHVGEQFLRHQINGRPTGGGINQDAL